MHFSLIVTCPARLALVDVIVLFHYVELHYWMFPLSLFSFFVCFIFCKGDAISFESSSLLKRDNINVEGMLDFPKVLLGLI